MYSYAPYQHSQVPYDRGSLSDNRSFAPPVYMNGAASGYESQLPPAMAGSANLPAFAFSRRRSRLNWRLISAINLEKVFQEVNLSALESVLENITFSDIDLEEDWQKTLDPNFVKIFKLSQWMAEYLLYYQDFLLAKVNRSEGISTNLQSEVQRLQQEIGRAHV